MMKYIRRKKMILEVKREKLYSTYTVGKLYVNGKYFCDTLEDIDRDLTSAMSTEVIKQKKVYGETAIPRGSYKVTLNVKSPKFSKYPFYMEVCGGNLPRICKVPGFEGVLIHVADGYKKDKLLQGCIGIGKANPDGSLYNGKETFKKLYETLKTDSNNITLTISKLWRNKAQ